MDHAIERHYWHSLIRHFARNVECIFVGHVGRVSSGGFECRSLRRRGQDEGSTERRKKRQKGQEIHGVRSHGYVFGSAVIGILCRRNEIIKNLQANQVVRDLDNIYIHGGDFSTYPLQQLAQRLGQGLNSNSRRLGTASTIVQSNTGSSGDGLIWVSQVMYIGATTDPNCVAVGASNCTNHDSFVFTQRIVFGNSSLNTSSQRLG